jgi:transposase
LQCAFTTIYEGILREGEALNPEVAKKENRRGRSKQSIAFNLLRRLRQHGDAVLFFIRDLTIPFTNKLGERAVRMPKVKQKISGCFRSIEGAENFCAIRSKARSAEVGLFRIDCIMLYFRLDCHGYLWHDGG